jgi:hypothetical protein
MLRKYNVSIVVRESELNAQLADNIATDFDCLVSEPSIWLAAGLSSEKGLSFLDKQGGPLRSSVFKDQAYFGQPDSSPQKEENAIIAYIHATLSGLYLFETKHVKVKVTLDRKQEAEV